jgi:hypothetical protein
MKRIFQLVILILATQVACSQVTQKFSDLTLYIGFGDSTQVPVLLKSGSTWLSRKMWAIDLARGKVDSIRIKHDSAYQWNSGSRTFIGMVGSSADVGLTQAQTDALYVPLSRTVNGHALNLNINVTKGDVGLSNVPNLDLTNPVNITQDATHRFATDAEKTTWNAKQAPITTGTTLQYIDGTLGLRTFPVNVSTFTNDAGYFNAATGDSRYPLKSGAYSDPTWITSLDWTKIANVPNYVSTINTFTPTAIAGLVSGNSSQKISQTTIASPITYDYSTTTLGIKIANVSQDGALSKVDYLNFNTAFEWGNHAARGYLTRDSIPDDSTVLLDPLTTIVGGVGQNDTMMVFNADSLGQAGVITSAQYKRFQYSTMKWTLSGAFSGSTITLTRNDGTTYTVTGLYNNPLTTLGDLVYEDATPTPVRLAGNTTTTKKFLTQTGNGSISAAPGWSTILSADLAASPANAKLLVSDGTNNTWSTNLTWNSATLGGYLQLGANTSSNTSNTTMINMGGTFNPSIKNTKLRLFDDGTNVYGFGANLGELAYVIGDNISDHVFYVNGAEVLRIYNTAQTNNPGAVYFENGERLKRTAVADAAYTILKTDRQICYTSITAARAVTLPTAATVIGQHFTIQDESGSATGTLKITIVGTINGASNPDAITTAYGTYRFFSNGAAFFKE